MKPNAPMAVLLVGFLAGAITQLARSDTKQPEPPKANPNVVVLHAEKTVTIERPQVTLAELAAELGKQTGYTFRLGEPYAKSKTNYSALFHNTPYSRVLAASGYLNGAKWRRKGTIYTLSPLTQGERVLDAERFEGIISRLEEYFSNINPDDPTLSDRTRPYMKGIGDWAADRDELPLFTIDNQDKWRVRGDAHSLSYTYESQKLGLDGRSYETKAAFARWK